MIKKYFLRDKNRALSKAKAMDIFKGAYVTEKTAQMAQEGQCVVMKVELSANKIDIKRAFEEVFQMPVESVNTLITKPRMRHFKGKPAQRAPIKKAVIKLKKGADLNKILGAV